MKTNSDLEMHIKKVPYNKTVLQPDGVTQIVDTSKNYIAYQFELFKNYFDKDSDEEAIRCIIADLKSLTLQLENTLQNSKHDLER